MKMILFKNKNPLTKKYSIISFGSVSVPFVTGDRVFYSPEIENDPLVGLESGFYYVEKVVNDQNDNNKIRLYRAPAFIEANDFIEFDVPVNKNTGHTFTLASQYNKKNINSKNIKKISIRCSTKFRKRYRNSQWSCWNVNKWC